MRTRIQLTRPTETISNTGQIDEGSSIVIADVYASVTKPNNDIQDLTDYQNVIEQRWNFRIRNSSEFTISKEVYINWNDTQYSIVSYTEQSSYNRYIDITGVLIT